MASHQQKQAASTPPISSTKRQITSEVLREAAGEADRSQIQEQNSLFMHPAHAKIVIGEPNGPHEREADTVAKEVVNTIYSSSGTDVDDSHSRSLLHDHGSTIRRKAITPVHSSDSTSAIDGHSASTDVANSLQKGGQAGHSLSDHLRLPMEEMSGVDLSMVQVHADAQADELTRKTDALAFTYGHDIYFRNGFYSPHSRAGQELIAHETTHVIQQAGNSQSQQGIVQRTMAGKSLLSKYSSSAFGSAQFKQIVATVSDYESFLDDTVLGSLDAATIDRIRRQYMILRDKLAQDCTSYGIQSSLHLGGHREAIQALMLELPKEVKWVELILQHPDLYPGYSLNDAIAIQEAPSDERATQVQRLVAQSELSPDLTSASSPTDLDELRQALIELKAPLHPLLPSQEEPTDQSSLAGIGDVAVYKLRKQLKEGETTTAMRPEFEKAWDARVKKGSSGLGAFMRTGDPISATSGYYARHKMQTYFQEKVQPMAADMAAQLTTMGMGPLYSLDPVTHAKVVSDDTRSFRQGAVLYHDFMTKTLSNFPHDLVEGAAHVYASVRVQSRQYISEQGTIGSVEQDESFSKELARFSITNMLMLRSFNTGLKYPFYRALGRYADPENALTKSMTEHERNYLDLMLGEVLIKQANELELGTSDVQAKNPVISRMGQEPAVQAVGASIKRLLDRVQNRGERLVEREQLDLHPELLESRDPRKRKHGFRKKK